MPDYKQIKLNFIIVNSVSLISIGIMASVLLAQHFGLLPSNPCVIHYFLHLYCPGCGGTRAIGFLLQGRLISSLIANPAVLLGGLLALYYEVGVLLTLALKNNRCYFWRKPYLAYLYLVIIFVYSVVRDVLLVCFQTDILHDFI